MVCYVSIQSIPVQGGKGGEVPPPEGSLSPTAIFNIPDQGCNSEKKFLPALFPPLRKNFSPRPIPPSQKIFLLPALFPHLKIWFLPRPFPPSPKIIWPIPCPHHPSLPSPHPLSQKSKFISPSYIFYFPAHIPLLNFFLVPHAYPPPENFRKMWSEKFSPCPIPPSRKKFFSLPTSPLENFWFTSPSMKIFRAQVCI